MTALTPAWAPDETDAATKDRSYQHNTALGPTVKDYLDRRLAAGASARTVEEYEYAYRRLCLLHPEKTAGEITTRILEAVVATWPPGSRGKHAAAFRALFGALYYDEEIEADPARRLPTYRTERQKIIDVFTDVEQEALKTQLGELRDRALTTLLLETGLRKAEACALTVADLDLDGGRLSIRRGKGRKGRVVPMPPSTCRVMADLLLVERLDRHDHLWYARYVNWAGETVKRGGELGPGAFHRWWVRMCDEAGVRYRSPHVCRHTYATMLLNRRVPMAAVSRLLGHASVRTTVDVYAHLAVEDLAAEIARAFDPVGK